LHGSHQLIKPEGPGSQGKSGKKVEKIDLEIPGRMEKNAILKKSKFYKKIPKSVRNWHEKAIFKKSPAAGYLVEVCQL